MQYYGPVLADLAVVDASMLEGLDWQPRETDDFELARQWYFQLLQLVELSTPG